MLVGAFACAHTPQLLVRPDTEDRDLVLRVHAAFARVKQRLQALRPDVVVMIAGDHVHAFDLTGVPPFAVYTGQECRGRFGRYEYRFPIDEPLARGILEGSIERRFDVLYTQDAPLDYAFYVPLHFTMPDPPVPLVPLHVNVYLAPQPIPQRCYEWGVALREILDARPERVVMLASGGMSHFPGTDRYGSPEFDYDRELLERMRQGRGREFAAITAQELDKMGNIELRTWITVLGAVGDAPADVYCYEPSWHHGNGIVEWPITPKTGAVAAASAHAAPEDLHYTFPPASAYALNRCLFALKSDADFRARYIKDPEAAGTEMGLSEDERRALRTNDRNALVARGGHSYLVAMAFAMLAMSGDHAAFEYF